MQIKALSTDPTIIELYVDGLVIAGKTKEATAAKDFLNSRLL